MQLRTVLPIDALLATGKKSVRDEVEAKWKEEQENYEGALVRSNSFSLANALEPSVVVMKQSKTSKEMETMEKAKVRLEPGRREGMSGSKHGRGLSTFYDITNKLPLIRNNNTRHECLFLRKHKNCNISQTIKLSKFRERALSKLVEGAANHTIEVTIPRPCRERRLPTPHRFDD